MRKNNHETTVYSLMSVRLSPKYARFVPLQRAGLHLLFNQPSHCYAKWDDYMTTLYFTFLSSNFTYSRGSSIMAVELSKILESLSQHKSTNSRTHYISKQWPTQI